MLKKDEIKDNIKKQADKVRGRRRIEEDGCGGGEEERKVREKRVRGMSMDKVNGKSVGWKAEDWGR